MIIKYIWQGILVLLGIFVFQVTLSGYARKLTARLQKRYGPPVIQNFWDIFKLFAKRSSISHGLLFEFGIWMALGGTLATALLVPVANWTVIPDTANFIAIIYLLAVGSLGMAMSSVASANPNASIGISRALTQMLGYELPFVVIAIIIMHHVKSSNLITIAQDQIKSGWNIIRYPLGAIVGYISLLGMLGKKPFDSPIAPAEIASGPLVEYSGKNLGMLMVQHEFATFVEITLFIYFFLGGSKNIFDFMIKYFIVWSSAVMVSALMPRYRIEQAIKFYWKIGVSIAFVQALYTYILKIYLF